MGYYGGWAEYVPVAKKKEKAAKYVKLMRKKGHLLNPVVIESRAISKTFWGKAWCENLENYSDYDNRLPRGRTYARNGSVIDLQVTKGKIKAKVMGSELYLVDITISPIPDAKWKTLVKKVSGKIDSLMELLKGKFSKAVMEIITNKENEVFPKLQEIKMSCSCPDYADMCKHISAVLYGIGASLDNTPENLFIIRQVDHLDLIASATSLDAFEQNQNIEETLDDSEISSLFGIEMDSSAKTKAKLKKPSNKKVLTKKKKISVLKEKPISIGKKKKKIGKKEPSTKTKAKLKKPSNKKVLTKKKKISVLKEKPISIGKKKKKIGKKEPSTKTKAKLKKPSKKKV